MHLAGIETVIDVGANIGQFGIDIRRSGFKGRIVSFEPVSKTFQQLKKTAGRHTPWNVFQLALGAKVGKEQINISGNSGLSTSFLHMNKLHLDNFPSSRTIGTESVEVSTLDIQIDRLKLEPKTCLLKIDVQGFEANVISGAKLCLSDIPYCYLEVSLTPLYSGESSMLEILNLLADAGHQVLDVFRGVESRNGELLQLDILTRQSNR
jgi:FkbM family methyltransferase